MGTGVMPDPAFWYGKRVLVTGHTGFKGAWITRILLRWGARVTGLALAAETPSLFRMVGDWQGLDSHVADLRDHATVAAVVAGSRPEIVLHLGAQTLVRRSYRDPLETFATNVLGTAHLLDALCDARDLAACLVATSDKVYRNDDRGRSFREDDPLGGGDPYSASKAAVEMVVGSMRTAGRPAGARLATARGGNVIGGGDYAEDRLVPDIIRAIATGAPLVLRSPEATRPWQHVLDVATGYLLYAEALASARPDLPVALNFGPSSTPSLTVGEAVDRFLEAMGHPLRIEVVRSPDLPEKGRLSLDSSRAATALGFKPRYGIREALQLTAAWYQAVRGGHRADDETDQQIAAHFGG